MFPSELVAQVNRLIWSKLRQYFVLGPTSLNEDHVGSGPWMYQKTKIQIQKFIESSSEVISDNLMKSLDRSIGTLWEYNDTKKELAIWITLQERASGIPYASIDQQLCDEWVLRQMAWVNMKPSPYPRELRDTFIAAERRLLQNRGMPFSELRHHIEYVFKEGPLCKPSLFTSLRNVPDDRLAEEIRLSRMDYEIQQGYQYNLAYRKSRDPPDEATTFWERMRHYNLLLQNKSRSIAGARSLAPRTSRDEQLLRLSSSSESVGEGTESFLKAASPEESEESESGHDSNDERTSVLSRTETLSTDDRQGDDANVDTVPGVTRSAKYKMTSIKTRMPPEQSLSGHTHVYVVTDERSGIKWLQGVRKEVIASPTKRRRYDPRQPFNGSEPPSYEHTRIQNMVQYARIDSGSPG